MNTYKIEGMTCGGCAGSISKALELALPGVAVEVSFEAGQVVVRGDHDPAVVEQAVEDAGFDFVGRA